MMTMHGVGEAAPPAGRCGAAMTTMEVVGEAAPFGLARSAPYDAASVGRWEGRSVMATKAYVKRGQG